MAREIKGRAVKVEVMQLIAECMSGLDMGFYMPAR
jgi:hypothetical protein